MSTVHNITKQPYRNSPGPRGLQIRDNLEIEYADVYTPEVLEALKALSVFNKDQNHETIVWGKTVFFFTTIRSTNIFLQL